MAKQFEEEYELIPMSPIRRLEKRVDQIESTAPGFDAKDFLREFVSIMRMNQQLVDELAKANDAMRIEISKLPAKLEALVANMTELISYIKASAIEETSGGTNLKPLLEKMDALVEGNKKVVETNQSMLAAIEQMDRRMRRPVQPLTKPLLPSRPLQLPQQPRQF